MGTVYATAKQSNPGRAIGASSVGYVTEKRKSKMNMFEKWIMGKSKKIQRKYEDMPQDEVVYNRTISRSSDLSDNRPMTFNIYRASGGSIVELRKYDNRRDHWDNQLHVIPDDADFNDHLSKIVTLETLRA